MQCVYKSVACHSVHKVSSLQWEAVSVRVKATVVIYYNVNDDWGMENEQRAKNVNLWSWVILKIAVVMCHAKQVTLFLCVCFSFSLYLWWFPSDSGECELQYLYLQLREALNI